MIRRAGLFVIVVACCVGVSWGQPESGDSPKTGVPAKPVDHRDRLKPWKERVDPRAIGKAYSTWIMGDRILEIAAEDPALAEAVRAAKARREAYAGGCAAIVAQVKAAGEDIDAIMKPVLQSAEPKLREAIRSNGAEAIKQQENFEQIVAFHDGMSLFLAFQQGYGEKPESAAKLDLLMPIAASRKLKVGTLTSEIEFPSSWRAVAGEKNIVLRCTSGGGFGHEVLTVFVDAVDGTLNEEQEAGFWKLIQDPAKYPAGDVPVEIKERKIGERRAVEATFQATSEAGGCKQRLIIRQVSLLYERQWTITIQLMATTYVAADKEIPTPDEAKSRIKVFSPVLEKALETLQVKVEAAKPEAPPAEK